MKKFNIVQHSAGDRCPACSSDKDKNGRLIIKVSHYLTKNGNYQFYLECSGCKFRLSKQCVRENKMKVTEKMYLVQALWQQAKLNNNLE